MNNDIEILKPLYTGDSYGLQAHNDIVMSEYQSWGRYPKHHPRKVVKLLWRDEIPELSKFDSLILPFGYGKSYGDSCLNNNGIIIDTKGLNHLMYFDNRNGILKCESGTTLAEILSFAVPRGWFLRTTPGTKYISVGGAIANDVHGKNHHKSGTFGCHLISFELLRSDGTRVICSKNENSELFSATIGGLGLTGLITWVEMKLKRCASPFIEMESIKFDSLDDFMELSEESDRDYEYTVSWIDSTATGSNAGRGIFSRGNNLESVVEMPKQVQHDDWKENKKALPVESTLINSFTVQVFNTLYYNKQLDKTVMNVVHYDKFFYPLDSVNNWNRAYGKSGFLQYQFVVPFENGIYAIRDLLKEVAKSGLSSFLTVLKTFGAIKSPGLMSFPRPGITLAIDFRMTGNKTLKLLDTLDVIVREAGGGFYPAKDARMKSSDFHRFYPNVEEFKKFIDPKFSSDFWRRVNS